MQPAVRTAATRAGIPPVFLQAIVVAEGGEIGFCWAMRDRLLGLTEFEEALEEACRVICCAAFTYAMEPGTRSTVSGGQLVQRNFLEYLEQRLRGPRDISETYDPPEDWVDAVRIAYTMGRE